MRRLNDYKNKSSVRAIVENENKIEKKDNLIGGISTEQSSIKQTALSKFTSIKTIVDYYRISNMDKTHYNTNKNFFDAFNNNLINNRYKKISDFIIIHNGNDKEFDVSEETKGIETTVKAEILILADTIEPLPGDLIIMQFRNKPSLWSVVETTPQDTTKNPAYVLNILLRDENLELNSFRLESLEKSVDSHYSFKYEHIGSDFKTVISAEENNILEVFKDLWRNLSKYYNNNFFNKEINTYDILYEYNRNKKIIITGKPEGINIDDSPKEIKDDSLRMKNDDPEKVFSSEKHDVILYKNIYENDKKLINTKIIDNYLNKFILETEIFSTNNNLFIPTIFKEVDINVYDNTIYGAIIEKEIENAEFLCNSLRYIEILKLGDIQLMYGKYEVFYEKKFNNNNFTFYNEKLYNNIKKNKLNFTDCKKNENELDINDYFINTICGYFNKNINKEIEIKKAFSYYKYFLNNNYLNTKMKTIDKLELFYILPLINYIVGNYIKYIIKKDF